VETHHWLLQYAWTVGSVVTPIAGFVLILVQTGKAAYERAYKNFLRLDSAIFSTWDLISWDLILQSSQPVFLKMWCKECCVFFISLSSFFKFSPVSYLLASPDSSLPLALSPSLHPFLSFSLPLDHTHTHTHAPTTAKLSLSSNYQTVSRISGRRNLFSCRFSCAAQKMQNAGRSLLSSRVTDWTRNPLMRTLWRTEWSESVYDKGVTLISSVTVSSTRLYWWLRGIR
jgi:hypothetical protein